MKIEIRPIEKKTWHNKTGKESFTRPKVIQALADPRTQRYMTGLTELELKELSVEFDVDLTPRYNPTRPHTFWDSRQASVKLENAPQFFDTSIPLELIKYKICKASKYVANSKDELERGLFPEAHHVIYDEQEEAEVKAKRIELRNTAIAEIAKLSRGRKIDLLFILEGKNYKEASENLLTVGVEEMLENKSREVLEALKDDPEYIEAKALVVECLSKIVLIKRGHKIMYHESSLGDDISGVANYLNKDENQTLKLTLQQKVM